MIRLSALAIAIFLVDSQLSHSPATEYSYMGFGANSCAEFSKNYQDNPSLFGSTYFTWAQGYMSGMNGISLARGLPWRDLSSLTVDIQEYQIRDYCNEHPTGDYLDAVLTLYYSMTERAPPKSPRP